MALPLETQIAFVDWVTEKRMAELTGLSDRALQHRRISQRGRQPAHPRGLVWEYFDGRVMYSIKGYNEWADAQRTSLKGLRSEATELESVSAGVGSASVSPIRTRQPRKTSSAPVVVTVK